MNCFNKYLLWKKSLNIGDEVIIKKDDKYQIVKIKELKYYPVGRENKNVNKIIWDKIIILDDYYCDVLPYDNYIMNLIKKDLKEKEEQKIRQKEEDIISLKNITPSEIKETIKNNKGDYDEKRSEELIDATLLSKKIQNENLEINEKRFRGEENNEQTNTSN